MVIIDSDDGVLAPVDDADALAAAIEPLMRDPERIEAMGRRARHGSSPISAATGRPMRSAPAIRRSGGRKSAPRVNEVDSSAEPIILSVH
jgi:hypothetical protein